MFETHRNWKPRNYGHYQDGTKIEDPTLENEDLTPVEDVGNMLNILDSANIEYTIECDTSHIEEKDGSYHIRNVRVDVIHIKIPASLYVGKCRYPVYLSYCPPWTFGPYRWKLFSESGINFKELLKFTQKFPTFIEHLFAKE